MELWLVAAWLAAVIAVGLMAVPLSAWAFPRGEYGAYAVTLGVVTIGVIGHLVGHLAYRWPALAAGVIGLFALSAVGYRRVEIDWSRLVVPLVIFTGAFLFVVGLRALDPSAATNPHYYGEMFLDFGLLSSLERAGTLPPEDMWFAGETVRYHYGGQLLVSLLAGLSSTQPAVAYNLGFATFFAMLVTMAWGVAGSIARPMAISTRWAAAAGAFFVAIAGNLETAMRVVVWLAPRRLAETVAGAIGADEAVVDWSPGEFFYWDASRVIFREEMIQAAATEFPLFSWLHGDLHAHVLVKPLLLLLVAIGVAYWYTPHEDRRRRLALVFLAMPPVVGLISVVNVWSVPVVAGLVGVMVFFAPGQPLGLLHPAWPTRLETRATNVAQRSSRPGRVLHLGALEGGRLLGAVVVAVSTVVLGIAWSAPYWWLVVLGGPGESIDTWSTGTPLGEFLVVQGAFVVGFTLYLGARVIHGRARWHFIAAAALVVVLGWLLGWAVLALTAVLLVAAWWSLREDAEAMSPASTEETARVGPETMLLLAGLGIVLIVELVLLSGDTFNSVFKPYADVWQLWGVALGVVAVRLVDGWPLALPDRSSSAWAAGCLVLVAVLVVATGLYGVLAIPAHVDDGNSARFSPATEEVREAKGLTLDATAYLDVLYPEEAEAIEWLSERDGTPTIVTGAPAGYWWCPDASYEWCTRSGEGAAAPASMTGLPTVLGWTGHQAQYRGGTVVDERLDAVAAIYRGSVEEQRAALEAYDVDYVYVGPAERDRWSTITIGYLDETSVAAELGSVTIYAVDLGD